jgi:histidinol-phosphatase (PHP family)
LAEQAQIYDKFYHTALNLQKKYEKEIQLLVGLEIDWIRPESEEWIKGLLSKYQLDLFVGSVHHVHGIPIDFDATTYEKAQTECLGRAGKRGVTAEEILYEDYFDAQFNMLAALKPPVVGHLDLIRLLSKNKDADLRLWIGVWEKVKRNLAYIKEYGGAIELNSAGLRKGLREPYPQLEICKVRFCSGFFPRQLIRIVFPCSWGKVRFF